MMRKLLVILFFVIVFGLPVAWYLILQIFGENKFDLPKLGTIQNGCISKNAPATLILEARVTKAVNEWNRLNAFLEHSNSGEIEMFMADSCNISSSAVLVESSGEVRGEYGFTREEVDRMITEMDIYLLNLKDDSEGVK